MSSCNSHKQCIWGISSDFEFALPLLGPIKIGLQQNKLIRSATRKIRSNRIKNTDDIASCDRYHPYRYISPTTTVGCRWNTKKKNVSRKDEYDDDGSKGLKYKNILLFYLFIFFLCVDFLMIGVVLCCVVSFRFVVAP